MGLVVKKLPADAQDARDSGFDPWVGKMLWRPAQQPTPVFLPGKFHGWPTESQESRTQLNNNNIFQDTPDVKLSLPIFLMNTRKLHYILEQRTQIQYY